MADLIRVRRDPEWKFEQKNKVYKEGEILAITDKYYFKIGNGIDDFKTLQKFGGNYDNIMSYIDDIEERVNEALNNFQNNTSTEIHNIDEYLNNKINEIVAIVTNGLIDKAPASHIGSRGINEHGLANGTPGFSTEDFSTGYKTKLSSIEDKAQVNIIETVIKNGIPLFPVNKTIDLELDKRDFDLGYVTNDAQVRRDEMGAINGVATLDVYGKVPSTQLPSYVDDMLEYESITLFPGLGESGKIYVDTNSNLTYRWGGSGYVEISSSLALGETMSTAYRGDLGAIAYTHSQIRDNPHDTTAEQVGATPISHVGSSGIEQHPLGNGTPGFSTNDYTTDEKSKLYNIASNAQVNVIETIQKNGVSIIPSGKTVNISLSKNDVGLTNADDTADSNKNVLSASKLTTSKTLALTGDITGSINTDFSGNVSITTTQVANKSNQKLAVSKNSTTATGTRKQINFKDGSNVTVAVADNSTNDAVDVTIFAIDTVYTHPTGDGNSHIPATGTTNNTKVLKAGSTANSSTWGQVLFSEIGSKPTTLSGYGITDAEPSQTLVTQAEAESGTSTTVKAWTPQRVAQAIAKLQTKYASLSDVDTRIQAVIGTAPSAFDTLKELADALNNDPNFATTITTALSNKEPLLNTATLKTALVDADTIPLSDSSASNSTKKITWVNIKAVLKTYFDTLYTKVIVNNTITSTSTTEALSAAQGKSLNDTLASKAPLASPTFSGTPTAPTAPTGTNSTQIATTAFVNNQITNQLKFIDY